MERQILVGLVRSVKVDPGISRWSRIFWSEGTEPDLSIWFPTISGIIISTVLLDKLRPLLLILGCWILLGNKDSHPWLGKVCKRSLGCFTSSASISKSWRCVWLCLIQYMSEKFFKFLTEFVQFVNMVQNNYVVCSLKWFNWWDDLITVFYYYTVQLRYMWTTHMRIIRVYFAYTHMLISAHMRIYTCGYMYVSFPCISMSFFMWSIVDQTKDIIFLGMKKASKRNLHVVKTSCWSMKAIIFWVFDHFTDTPTNYRWLTLAWSYM